MLWLLLVYTLVIFITFKTYKSLTFWERKGVTHIKPWPMLGSFAKAFLKKQTIIEQVEELYYTHPEAKFIGIHQFLKPTMMIRDPEMIQEVTVKNFDNFIDRTMAPSEDAEPLIGKNLFSLQGQRWKDMRATLSPAFTGSKMRKMYVLIKEAAEQFTNYFLQKEEDTLILEMKDIFTKYTNDVIATCAFGVKCDSLKDDKNEFYVMGEEFTRFGVLFIFKLVAFALVPKLMHRFHFTLLSSRFKNFFLNLIRTTIETRERNNIIRPDLIHLLMEARKGRLRHEQEEEDAGFATVEESHIGRQEQNIKQALTDEDITAQAILFFAAGYDTGSTLMCFLSHELAINPDIQRKLQEEIDATYKKCGGDLDYDSLLKMRYLDMVISECLRKWPPAFILDRKCANDYTLASGDESATLDKDMSVLVPIYSLHHDEKYFKDPERFDPERFSDENKANIQPFAYIPFGSGPRNCIGSRFALLEVKTLIVTVLSKFDIVVTEKTQIPLKLAAGNFQMKSEKGFWLRFKRRNN